MGNTFAFPRLPPGDVGGARFIAPSQEEIATILAKHRFLKAIAVPAGTYPNQPRPIESVGSWSFVFARNDLPDETGYRLARALHKAQAALAKRLPQANETTAANTFAAADRSLIQPGVMRYLVEAGIAR